MKTNGSLDVTQYSCNECEYRAWMLGAIRKHVYQTHANIDDHSPAMFDCGECKKTFTTEDELDTHQETHIPSANASCLYCNSSFHSTGDAVDHFWAAHPEESSAFTSQFVCPLNSCDTSCDTIHNLVNHINESHGDNIVPIPELAEGANNECPLCDSQLADRKGLFQHASQVHPELFNRGLYCTICDTPEMILQPDEHIKTHHNPNKQSTGVHSKCPEPECSFSPDNQPNHPPKHQRHGHHYRTVEDHYRHEHLSTSTRCPHQTCNYRDTVSSRINRHHWATHETDTQNWDVTVVQTIPKDFLESLYAINKHAKKYGRLGEENYKNGKGATAKANSVKKDALYGVKEAILSRIYENADTLAIHEIDGNKFWFTDFGTFSFHSPLKSLDLPYDRVEYQDELENFDPGEEKEHTDDTLKKSLLNIESKLGVNANDHLGQTHIGYGANSYFVGWTYLDDGDD